MAEPLSVIGAIAACQQIVFRLAQVVKALAAAGKEQASMVLRLKHQAILLQGFSELVAEFEPEFDSNRRDHFDIVIKHMQIVLESTLIKMEKVSKKRPSKLLWALAGNELKDAERELFDWSQRLMISFAFLSTPLKTSFVEKFSDEGSASSLPSWLLGLTANIRMEKGKDDVSVASTERPILIGLLEPTSWSDLHPEQLQQLWIDRINTTSVSRRGTMTMEEVQLEVSRLFAVLKQADAVANRILTAEHFLITDEQEHHYAIASNLPSDTCKQQLLSDMLVEASEHVSVSHLRLRSIAHARYSSHLIIEFALLENLSLPWRTFTPWAGCIKRFDQAIS
jgi:hypothetical protein